MIIPKTRKTKNIENKLNRQQFNYQLNETDDIHVVASINVKWFVIAMICASSGYTG